MEEDETHSGSGGYIFMYCTDLLVNGHVCIAIDQHDDALLSCPIDFLEITLDRSTELYMQNFMQNTYIISE